MGLKLLLYKLLLSFLSNFHESNAHHPADILLVKKIIGHACQVFFWEGISEMTIEKQERGLILNYSTFIGTEI